MYRSILVPLDGSSFAEQAIAPALTIAETCQAAVTLVRAWDPANYRDSSELTPPYLDPNAPEKLAATDYLNALVARLRIGTTVPIDVAVIAGSAPAAIRECLTHGPADLVVMTTHGLTGWSRAWIGSVADAVVRTVTAPILLVRPLEAEGPTSSGHFERVLIPLDGSAEAEEILAHAVELGGNARFILLRVERPVMPLHLYTYAVPAWEADQRATEEAAAYARDYLVRVANRLKALQPDAGVDVDVRLAERPVAAIIEAAQDYKADLVAITTHARRAVRLVLGSVADKVLRGTHAPVLVLRPSAPATRDGSEPTLAGAEAGRG